MLNLNLIAKRSTCLEYPKKNKCYFYHIIITGLFEFFWIKCIKVEKVEERWKREVWN